MSQIPNNFIGEYYINNIKLCDTITEWFHSGVELSAGTTTGGLKPDVKQSTDIMITTNTNYHWINDYLFELKECMNKYCEKFPACKWYGNAGIEEGFRVQWYKPGEGFHAWHTERCTPNGNASLRHLVFMTYLNDVNDAGETEFLHQEIKVKPVKGKTVIWPADWTYTHRGVPSPTQEKYILTGWYNLK
tara:strand:- start:992 stop:1558 length:567 start_codon:yes stop_codon:yes gene_type:complete